MASDPTRRWRCAAFSLAMVACVLIVARSSSLDVEWLVAALALALTSPLVLPIRWELRIMLALLTPILLLVLAARTCFGVVAWSIHRGESIFDGVH